MDRYNRQGRAGRAGGRGAQQSRRGSWRYKRWEDLHAADTVLAPPLKRWQRSKAELGTGMGIRELCPAGVQCPGHGSGSAQCLQGADVSSFLQFQPDTPGLQVGVGRGSASLGGSLQLCYEAPAWQAHAQAGGCPLMPMPDAAPEHWAQVLRSHTLRLAGGLLCPVAPSPGQGGTSTHRAGLRPGFPGIRPLPSPSPASAHCCCPGLPQPEDLPILGKKRTEKWQLPSEPQWLRSSSSRRRTGTRTGRRAADSRRRRQGCGGPRNPGASGALSGLRVKAQVSWPCLQAALSRPGEHLGGSLVTLEGALVGPDVGSFGVL